MKIRTFGGALLVRLCVWAGRTPDGLEGWIYCHNLFEYDVLMVGNTVGSGISSLV